MKAIWPARLPGLLNGWFAGVRRQRLWRDKLFMLILSASLLLNGLTLVLLAARLRPAGFGVPVHYSSLTGFDSLGPWYQSYRIGGFGLAVSVVNAVLALISYSRSRITSFFLISGSLVVSLFCLVVALSFSAVV